MKETLFYLVNILESIISQIIDKTLKFRFFIHLLTRKDVMFWKTLDYRRLLYEMCLI